MVKSFSFTRLYSSYTYLQLNAIHSNCIVDSRGKTIKDEPEHI